MTPTEARLISENATLRAAVTFQALVFAVLCLIGAAKIVILTELKSGNVAVDLDRLTVDIRLKTVSQ